MKHVKGGDEIQADKIGHRPFRDTGDLACRSDESLPAQK